MRTMAMAAPWKDPKPRGRATNQTSIHGHQEHKQTTEVVTTTDGVEKTQVRLHRSNFTVLNTPAKYQTGIKLSFHVPTTILEWWHHGYDRNIVHGNGTTGYGEWSRAQGTYYCWDVWDGDYYFRCWGVPSMGKQSWASGGPAHSCTIIRVPCPFWCSPSLC